MPELTKSILLNALDDWGEYASRFNRLAPDEKEAFLKSQGYASLKDLLAHISVWWEEAEAIIRATIEKRERPRRDYDFDSFNAESVSRFKHTSEAEFMDWYEAMRQRMIALVSGLTDEQIKIRRVSTWLNGTVLSHIKEHNLYASRFVVTDMLQREWADYINHFNALPEEKQKAFLEKQGFASFRDLIAHIVAWREDGLEVIDAISKDLDYRHPEKDTDAYNAQAVAIFGKLDEAEVWRRFEATRQSLIELAINLPDETFDHKYVQEWLKDDVIEHYFEHAL
jgi:hypothetical protein